MQIQPIIFNSVTAFVESIGRRIASKYGDLDQLTCIWVGPSALAISFRPAVNSPHPDYPLMFVTDSQISYKQAGIAEVQITYQGLLVGGNLPIRFPNPPIITVTPVQGSRDFETQYWKMVSPGRTITAPQLGAAQHIPPTYVYGTQKVNVRYIGTQVTLKYNHYPEPQGDIPFFTNLGFNLVSMQVLSEYFGQVTAIGTYTGDAFNIYTLLPTIPQTSPPIRISFLGMSMEQRGLWYEVTESYGPTF